MTRLNPLISIIVPVYKTEKELLRCVRSILCQSLTDFELILIDDGSPDGCPALCDKLKTEDDRIIVIHQENKGLSGARNTGLDAASGEYIGFVDSDDYIHINMYEYLYNAMKREHAQVAICNCFQVDEKGKRLTAPVFNYRLDACTMTGREVIEKLGKGGVAPYMISCNKLYHKSIFDGLRFAEGKIYEDTRIFCKIFARVETVVCLSERLYYYIRRANSLTRGKAGVRDLERAEAFYDCFCFLYEQGYYKLLPYAEHQMFWALQDVYYNLSRKEKSCRITTERKRQHRATIRIMASCGVLSPDTLMRAFLFHLFPGYCQILRNGFRNKLTRYIRSGII